jgi:hypothetical protein
MADITADLKKAFETNYDNEADAAKDIGAAIDAYFVGVTIALATGVSGAGAAEGALKGMNSPDQFATKLGEAVVAAAGPSETAAKAESGTAGDAPTFTFTAGTSPADAATHIQTQIDTAVKTWTATNSTSGLGVTWLP